MVLLLGKVGRLENSTEVLGEALDAIEVLSWTDMEVVVSAAFNLEVGEIHLGAISADALHPCKVADVSVPVGDQLESCMT